MIQYHLGLHFKMGSNVLVYVSIKWTTQTQGFSIRSRRITATKISNMLCPVHRVFWSWYTSPSAQPHNWKSHELGRGFSWSHSVVPPRPIHQTVKWLSNKAKIRSANVLMFDLEWSAFWRQLCSDAMDISKFSRIASTRYNHLTVYT